MQEVPVCLTRRCFKVIGSHVRVGLPPQPHRTKQPRFGIVGPMIPQNFADAFARVKELVSNFSENEERYLSPGYSEAQARLDFIDKFWIALGWDVGHENQTDAYKQEVKVERGVATNEWRKRSDYAFLSPNFRDVRFYVEAKKPHVGLDSPDFYFQTIRYGWNSHTPIAVLTDFEELRVLDCRYKPDIRTAIGHAVLKYHYKGYSDEQKFRTIYYLFSRESVLEGSIENFAKGLPKLSRKRAVRGAAKDEHQNIEKGKLITGALVSPAHNTTF